jgi:hypothetical protein
MSATSSMCTSQDAIRVQLQESLECAFLRLKGVYLP